MIGAEFHTMELNDLYIFKGGMNSLINNLHQATSANLLCQCFLSQHGISSRGFQQQNGMRNLQLVQGTICFVALCNQEFAVQVL